MKDIEEDLKRRYEEIEVPDYMFDTKKVVQRYKEEQRKKRRIILQVACVVVAFVLICVALVTVNINLKEKEQDTDNINAGNNYTEINDISGKIELLDLAIKSFEYEDKEICSIKIEEILQYKIVNEVPQTIVKAKVLNNHLGTAEDMINLTIYGGIFKVRELKENVRLEILDGINNYNDEQYVEAICYNYSYIPIAEKNKEYLVTMHNTRENNYELYNDCMYSFKEFDSTTNSIKNENGEWEKIDLERYIESHKK